MAVRDSWAVGSDTDRRVDVEDARLALGALWTPDGANIATRPGFRPGPGSGGQVTASSPTADVAVHVSPFQYVMPATRGVGPYLVTLDSAMTVDVLTDTPADPANPRQDLIIAQQSDAFYGDSSSDFTIRHLVGIASATPSDPPIDGSPDFVELARITVPAGATAITSGDITDLRPTPLLTVAVGGILPVNATAERPDQPWPGMAIYRTDWGWVEIWDGSAWRVRGTATASSLSALQTGVTDPFQGQLAVVRDRNVPYLYDGTAWKLVGDTGWQDITSQCVSVAGSALSEVSVRRYGPVAGIYVVLKLGTTISVPSGGNLTNTELFRLPSEWSPDTALNHQQCIGGVGATGGLGNFLVDPSDGGVFVSAVAPGASMDSGTTVNISGFYFL